MGGLGRWGGPGCRWLSLLALLALSACDGGPSGPGALPARAVLADATGGASLGAVVLEVQGRGIQGFEPRGDTRLYASVVAGRADVHRVVLVHPSGGEIGFEILVDDVDMESPIAEVIQAAGTDNAPLAQDAVVVRIEG